MSVNNKSTPQQPIPEIEQLTTKEENKEEIETYFAENITFKQLGVNIKISYLSISLLGL